VSNDINPSSVSPDGGIAQVESQVSVVQSGGVLLRAIAATHLEADPEFNGNSFLGGILGREAIESDLQARTLAALRKRLAVKRADKVLVIDVSVTSRDADKGRSPGKRHRRRPTSPTRVRPARTPPTRPPAR